MTAKENAERLRDIFGFDKAILCIVEIEDALTNYGAMSGELQNMDSEWRFWDKVKIKLNKL